MKPALATLLLFAAGLVFGQFKGAPDWVEDPPGDDFAFHGIGFADPEDNANYRLQARNLALRELAEKIFVSIDATTELQVKYDDDRISYMLDERVEVASSNYLMGYEMVDEWTNKKSTAYFVLFRLDRVTYLKYRRQYFEQLDEVLDLMEQSATSLIEEGELVRGINELSEALLRVDEEMHTIIESEYARHLEKRKLGLIYQMERVLSRLTFDVEKQYEVDMTVPHPFAIEDYVKDVATGLPVRHLNASLEVLQGDVFRYHFDRTTASDALLVEGFFPERGVARVRIKVEPPIPDEVKAKMDAAVLRRLSSPSIDLRFRPYTVSIIDASANDSPFDDFLRSITEDLGLQEVRESADMYIYVDTETDTNKRGRTNYQGRFQGKIWINKDSTGIPDFQYELPARSQFASTRQQAVNDAYQKSIDGSSKFLVEFVSYLCSKHP